MFGSAQTFRPGLLARLLFQNWKLILNPSKTDRIHFQGNDTVELLCLNVMDIGLTRAFVWHSVVLRSRGRTDTLTGLTKDVAHQMVRDLRLFINAHLAELIVSDRASLVEVDKKIEAITKGNEQYLAQSDVSRVVSGVAGSAAIALSHPIFDPSLIEPSIRSMLPDSFGFLTKPNIRYKYNENFVSTELTKFKNFFDEVGNLPLSDEQREACIRLEDNNILIASAGSGKSATLVGKVAYAIQKGLYKQDEILVLAYNKSAADELRVRIARQLGVSADTLKRNVTTFHALGLNIITEVKGRPPQLANWVGHPAGEAKLINRLIEYRTKTDAEFAADWLQLLTVFPKADMPKESFDSVADYERFISDRKSSTNKTVGTLAGVYVKSLQEQRIVNWLWMHSIHFKYERQVRIDEGDGTHRVVSPDFYYPSTDTLHEHFAINADGTSPFPNYVEHAATKRAGYRTGEMDFFETTSAQAYDGTLIDQLERELKARDIPFAHKSMEEVMKALSPVVIKHFHKLILVCIKHIRANHLTRELLLERANSLKDKTRARLFAKTIWKLAEGYSQTLIESETIDFDSMIADAVTLVEAERYVSPYSLILVDEFQDISAPNANLVKALKQTKAFAKLFVVGDDWQSIYRFAGSDITLFTQFEENFGASWRGRLQQTYRCNQLLADTAAQFVQKNPDQLKKDVKSTRDAIPQSIRVIPIDVKRGQPSFGDACHTVLQRLNDSLDKIAGQWRKEPSQKLKVLVLWRYNLLNPFVGNPRTYPNIEVQGLSFHRAKGLEADYTVLLDVSEGDYGVPSRIEDDELLDLVMPRPETYAYAEERRLFYVALTRASLGVYMLTNRSGPSRFIEDLCKIAGTEIRFEDVNGQELIQCPKCLAGQLVERVDRHGAKFAGCNQYPSCNYTGPLKPSHVVQPSVVPIPKPTPTPTPTPTPKTLEQRARSQKIEYSEIPVFNAFMKQDKPVFTFEKRLFGFAVLESSNWEELQSTLKDHNLDIVAKGGGMAIVRADTKEHVCKASEAGYGYPQLIERFRAGFPGHPHTWLAQRILTKNTLNHSLDRPEIDV